MQVDISVAILSLSDPLVGAVLVRWGGAEGVARCMHRLWCIDLVCVRVCVCTVPKQRLCDMAAQVTASAMVQLQALSLSLEHAAAWCCT